MRNINFYGSLGDFKKSIGVQADADRKTAEAMPLVMQDLVDIQNFRYSLPPDSELSPRIAKREEEGKKFVYENRLYKTRPKKVKTTKKNK
jgi:hypothetical protein